MVHIFKTNVQEEDGANAIVQKLSEQFPSSKINFDLEDCDKILRIEGSHIDNKTIIDVLIIKGFRCEILND
jgi:hypothetical protein